MKKKKVNPAVTERFRELQKKSWAAQQKKILEQSKVAASSPKSGK